MRQVLAAVLLAGFAAASSQTFGQEASGSKRVVLVELFTSQGCDMCPTAEKNLGTLDGSARVVPVAFHVDYFNEPWHDTFSDKLYSQRQAAYNSVYTKPKNAEYGIYYTPMIMVDGVQSENGRDPAGIQRAIQAALKNEPQVQLTTKFELKSDKQAGTVSISVKSPSRRADGHDVIVCAVLRDDQVITKVQSGENANKTLNGRFPARSSQFEITKLTTEKPISYQFSFKAPAGRPANRLGIVVFVQDQKSGEIYQSAYLPWQAKETETKPTAETSR